MSKAILVMDDMPKNCAECPMLTPELTCHYYGNWSKDRVFLKGDIKPDWCPLKEAPKKPDYPPINESSFVAGWNACIDEITGGSEEDE